jgi:hypothetical protein
MNSETIAAITGFFSGGLVTTFAAHFLSVHRDYTTARNTLKGHLGKWIGSLDQPDSDASKIHAEFAPHIMGYCGTAQRGFFPFRRAKFIRLCSAASKARPEERDYREKILALMIYA